jgi:hypothetical protein
MRKFVIDFPLALEDPVTRRVRLATDRFDDLAVIANEFRID